MASGTRKERMRRTSEYHMDCPCGAAIVTLALGTVTCEKCGREATVSFAVLTIPAKAMSTSVGRRR